MSCFFTVYDVSGGSGDRNCVVLNDIHIDVMDYIMPATCTDTEFRSMWAEFEWENKVLSRLFAFQFISCPFINIAKGKWKLSGILRRTF